MELHLYLKNNMEVIIIMKEIIKHHNGDIQDDFIIYVKPIIDMIKNLKKEYLIISEKSKLKRFQTK